MKEGNVLEEEMRLYGKEEGENYTSCIALVSVFTLHI